MDRPSKLEIFLKIVHLISKRSTCKKYKVGCIIVDTVTSNIISVGYNGTPKGYTHCSSIKTDDHEIGCLEIHAEVNALAKARNPEGHETAIYVTHKPCLNCAKTILAFKQTLNITSIVYMFDFVDKTAKEENISIEGFLTHNGISISSISIPMLETITNNKGSQDLC